MMVHKFRSANGARFLKTADYLALRNNSARLRILFMMEEFPDCQRLEHPALEPVVLVC